MRMRGSWFWVWLWVIKSPAFRQRKSQRGDEAPAHPREGGRANDGGRSTERRGVDATEDEGRRREGRIGEREGPADTGLEGLGGGAGAGVDARQRDAFFDLG